MFIDRLSAYQKVGAVLALWLNHELFQGLADWLIDLLID